MTDTDPVTKRVAKENSSSVLCSMPLFISQLEKVIEVEENIVKGLNENMPCRKKHKARVGAFKDALSLAKNQKFFI